MNRHQQLDCHTPRGRQYIERQMDVAYRVAERYGHDVIFTPDGDARFDCLFHKDGVLMGIAEIKVREMHRRDLERFGTYLVTEDKLLAGIEVASCCRVPFALIIALRDCDLFLKISDHQGNRVASWKADTTKTQATCNGGVANRNNAYINLKTAVWLV